MWKFTLLKKNRLVWSNGWFYSKFINKKKTFKRKFLYFKLACRRFRRRALRRIHVVVVVAIAHVERVLAARQRLKVSQALGVLLRVLVVVVVTVLEGEGGGRPRVDTIVPAEQRPWAVQVLTMQVTVDHALGHRFVFDAVAAAFGHGRLP